MVPKHELGDEGKEHIGGKYNLTLIETKYLIDGQDVVMNRLQYVKDGKLIDPDQMLPDQMRPSLDWLKNNVPEDSIIMSWWDYGNALRAYSLMEPVIDAPSKEILTKTVSIHIGKNPDDIECDNCIEHERVQDVARLLLSTDNEEAISLMKKYAAEYLYVQYQDKDYLYAFYVTIDQKPEELPLKSILAKVLNTEPIEGFSLVYEDDVAIIYQLID